MRDVLGLIGDLANCVGPRIKDSLRQPFIEKLVHYHKNEPDQNSKEIAEWTMEQIHASLMTP